MSVRLITVFIERSKITLIECPIKPYSQNMLLLYTTQVNTLQPNTTQREQTLQLMSSFHVLF